MNIVMMKQKRSCVKLCKSDQKRKQTISKNIDDKAKQGVFKEKI